jgi:hypothetical protein
MQLNLDDQRDGLTSFGILVPGERVPVVPERSFVVTSEQHFKRIREANQQVRRSLQRICCNHGALGFI